MKVFKAIRNLFSETHGEPDPVVALILTALENKGALRDLKSVLSQEPFHRQSLLNSMADEMSLRGADPEVTTAIRQLCDNSLAERVLRYLMNEEETTTSDGVLFQIISLKLLPG